MIDLSIIIVSWNVADLLVQCIESILDGPVALNTPDDTQPAYPVIEIIVVDSASQDDSVARVQERFPGVIVLAQTENVGFTRGNNIGLEQAQGRHLLLLNPDTDVIGDALPQMVAHLDNNPGVGIIGPHTLNDDGSTQSSRRRHHTRTLAFFESTWMQSLAPRHLLDEFYVADAPDDAILTVDWVQGSCLMARRAVYEQIGGLDEGFVMYFEEADWCKRATDAGWQVVYLGTAQIIHYGGKSTDQAGAWRHIHFQESKLRYYRKHHGQVFAGVLRVYLLKQYLWQLLLEAAKGLLGSKRDLRRERIQTYREVLRSGLKVT